MEQRRHPRIHLPLLVELKHPALGTLRCTARDISEGGVFVHTEKPQIRPGAQVKLTLQNTFGVEAQPTPTVDMEVVRVEDDGLGLAFASAAGRHLWQSVERLRTELAIGRDYFQVHLNALVIGPGNGVLLAQQHGKWAFPGTFLVVGENWQRYLQEFLQRELNVGVADIGPVAAVRSAGSPELPEAAVLRLFVEVRAASESCSPAPGSRYRSTRWIGRHRELEQTTVASEEVRELVAALLVRLSADEEGGAS